MLAPIGDRAVPTLSIFVVKTTRLYYIVRLMLAPSGDRAVPASLCFLIFCFGVVRTLSITIKLLLPQCLLQVETEQCPHCLNCLVFVAMKLMKIYRKLLVQSMDGCQETWGGCHGRWSLWSISFYNGATWCNSVVVVSCFDSVIDR